MNKYSFATIGILLFAIALFMGRKAGFQHALHQTVQQIAQPAVPTAVNPGKSLPALAPPAVVKTQSPLPVPLALMPGHTGSEAHLQRVRQVLKLKKYENVKLSAGQKESFKKVFLEIAASPRYDWLMQRQALRNLYLQKIDLSEQEQKRILLSTDQRALSNFKTSELELLKETVSTL